MAQRIIGIRHRNKKTVAEESRPTEVVILEGGAEVARYELEDEQAELDFLLGNFAFGKDIDGLRSGDTVAMTLGGSGDYFAFALARRGLEIGAKVARVPPYVLKERRGDTDKDDDARLIAMLYLHEGDDIFYEVRTRDQELIRIREAYNLRIDAMKERIACEQRLHQRLIGMIFCNAEGRYPEGKIEKAFDEMKANDKIYQAMLSEEKQRAKELQKLVEGADVWKEVFAGIEGMGWAIGSRIIAGVEDIRRFATMPKFKAFSGVHVLPDGRFPRRRAGSVANWHPDLRQAFFLFGDQMNRRPDSEWGTKLLEYKKKLRAAHPVVVEEGGKKRYTDGHILKMALWRTRTKFAEHLFKKWKRFERKVAELPVRKAA